MLFTKGYGRSYLAAMSRTLQVPTNWHRTACIVEKHDHRIMEPNFANQGS